MPDATDDQWNSPEPVPFRSPNQPPPPPPPDQPPPPADQQPPLPSWLPTKPYEPMQPPHEAFRGWVKGIVHDIIDPIINPSQATPKPPTPSEQQPEQPRPPTPPEQPKPDQPPEQKQPRPFTPYVPAVARAPNRWGKHNWPQEQTEKGTDLGDTKYMPHASESLRVLAGAAGQLSAMGPPSLSQNYNALQGLARLIGPFMDFYSGGRFGAGWDYANAKRLGFQRQQFDMQMELREQQMLDIGRQTLLEHKNMMEDYGEIFSLYENGGLTDDQARDAIEEQLRKHNRGDLVSLVENRGLQAVKNQLETEDKFWQDTFSSLMTVGNTRTTSSKTPKEINDYDKSLGSDGAGAGFTPLSVGPRGAPAPPQPGMSDLSQFDQGLVARNQISNTGLEAAREMARTGHVGGMTEQQFVKENGKNGPRVQAAARQIEDRENQIASGQGDRDSKLAEISQIDPTASAMMQGLLDYKNDPRDKENEKLLPMAKLIGGKNYNPGYFKTAQKYYDPNTKEGTIVQRSSTLPDAYITILNAINKLDNEHKSIPSNVIRSFLSEHFTGAPPEWAELHAAIRLFAMDVVGIEMGTGTPRVTIVNDLIKTMTETGSPAQIRAQARADLRIAYAGINNINKEWQRNTGSSEFAPGLDPKNENILYNAILVDPYTGVVPSEAPDELRGASRALPKGAHAPLNRSDISYWRQWLATHRNDPNAQLVREQLRNAPTE